MTRSPRKIVHAAGALLVAAAALTPTALGVGPSAPVYGYEIVAVRPHDPTSFTEGLEYRDGFLVESSGLKGSSSLRRVALGTGRVLQRIDVPTRYWAEGATVRRARIYQLTWTEHTGFVYDLKTFRLLRTFRYAGEGWGLTNDGVNLIMSDGTATLRFRDPATFAVRRTLTVRDRGRPVPGLNELELVRGLICANIYLTDRIACIDSKSGVVRYWIDLAGLLPPELQREGGSLNGIAYDANRDRLFVTGKLWPRLYEIRLAPRAQA